MSDFAFVLLLGIPIAILLSVLINFLLYRFSKNLGARNLNKKDEMRWSSTKKPALGGISFFIIFLIFFSAASIFIEAQTAVKIQMLGFTGACLLAFVLGLADDTFNTNPLVKFIGQLTCAFILISSGLYIPVFNIPQLDFVISVIWVIGMMNSLNMLDNMDAITTVVSISIIIGLLTLLFVGGSQSTYWAIILTGVLGALIGFLYFNWNPSRMYMGDTGSMFLGVFLAGASMAIAWSEKSPYMGVFQLKQFVFPLLLFIVPLIDTTTVTIRRLMRRQSPFVGGRDHTTHHLSYLGLADSTIAIVLFLLSLLSIPILLLVRMHIVKWNYFYTAACIVYFVLVFIVMQLLYDAGQKKLANKNNDKV